MNNMHHTSRLLLVCLASTVILAFISKSGASQYKSCIIKGKVPSKDNDLNSEDEEIEDPHHYYRYRRRIAVKLNVFHRCGSRLCKSRTAKVYQTTCRRGCLRRCHYSRYNAAFICVSYRSPKNIRIYWPSHVRTLFIRGITRSTSIKAVMPRVRYAKLFMRNLVTCKSNAAPKSIIITEALQGKNCPNGRIRFPVGSRQFFKDRLLDGRLNNKKKIFNGAAGERYLRLSGNGYADKVSVLSGSCSKSQMQSSTCPFPKENNGTGSNRPSARYISNILLSQNKDIPSSRGLSDLSVYFGQFLDHDTDLTPELPRNFEHKRPIDVEVPITVPKGDVIFDPDSKGNETIPVRRFRFDTCTGERRKTARQHINVLSAILDANTVYGSDEKRSKALRTLKDGLLKTDKGNLPLNTFNLPNGNVIGREPTKLRIAGDVRANVAPTLLVLHTVFVREHNRLAKLYKRRHPKASDEKIFQYARKLVIAEMQAITYREYIPSLIGRRLAKYRGYNPKINSAITTEFATAAFRFGHSQINTQVFRFDKNGKVSPYGHLLLREGYFRPERVTEEGGLAPILRGAVKQPAQEVDTKVVDELRNFLFPKKGVGLDLAAINIQRGREIGIPDYNTVRKALGLRRVTSFSQITRNRKIAKKLQSLYKSVNNVDLWVGGLAEDHVRGSELGPTFEKIFINQMKRIRDGDRFWYERIMTKDQIRYIHSHTLSRLISLNTEYKNPPKNVFFSCSRVRKFQCVKTHPGC